MTRPVLCNNFTHDDQSIVHIELWSPISRTAMAIELPCPRPSLKLGLAFATCVFAQCLIAHLTWLLLALKRFYFVLAAAYQPS
jgi:hypothetical protein